jgi:hypothetical protein
MPTLRKEREYKHLTRIKRLTGREIFRVMLIFSKKAGQRGCRKDFSGLGRPFSKSIHLKGDEFPIGEGP